ncbi:MAG: CBS domain-containing protein [Rhizobiales bacterium]|nr:CBS domain-containing protein [Hyphomicrobiales bacterium]
MAWSLNIGRIAGTEIRIHFTFLLFLIWIFAASYAAGGTAAAWDSTVFIILLFGCVLLHEYGHILTARVFGVATPDVTLLPIGGVARLERIPEEPYQEFLVAIAGPAVNVVIAFALVAFAGASLDPQHLAAVGSSGVSMVDRLAIVNVFLVLFNLIPAFPMDGGRVLRALLAIPLGFVRATQIAATIGQILAFVFGILGLFYSPMLILIAIFVYLAASSEAHLVALRSMSRGVPVGAAMVTQFVTLAPEDEIEHAVQTLLRTSQGEFPVVDGDRKPVGLLTRNDLIRAIKQLGPDARVGDAMSPGIPAIGQRRCLDEAFKVLNEKQAPAVAVVDSDGRLTGLVTSETIGEMIMLHNALPSGIRFGPWSRPAGA